MLVTATPGRELKSTLRSELPRVDAIAALKRFDDKPVVVVILVYMFALYVGLFDFSSINNTLLLLRCVC